MTNTLRGCDTSEEFVPLRMVLSTTRSGDFSQSKRVGEANEGRRIVPSTSSPAHTPFGRPFGFSFVANFLRNKRENGVFVIINRKHTYNKLIGCVLTLVCTVCLCDLDWRVNISFTSHLQHFPDLFFTCVLQTQCFNPHVYTQQTKNN